MSCIPHYVVVKSLDNLQFQEDHQQTGGVKKNISAFEYKFINLIFD